MKFVVLLLFGVQIWQISAKSNHRIERQASNYEFPGARIRRADSYYQPSARKPAQYEDLIEQYEPAPRVTAAQTYSPSVADPSDYSGQSYSQPASYRAGSRSRATYGNNVNSKDEEAAKLAEEEEEKKPDRLALLLAESKFSCGDKKDGYYADESVGCQVFHYCVSGAKHSWQCPENTVFHQIHLNCVPSAQDICQQSSKFHVVNDYLYKELEQRGPNNSIRYHQRYYPEGFDFGGDVLSQVLPSSQPQPSQGQRQSVPYNSYDDSSYSNTRGSSRSQPESYPSYQSYPAPAPAPAPVRAQPAPRTVYKPQVTRPAPAYTPPAYTTLAQTVPTRRPTTYTTPNAYPTSYSDSSDSDYPSSGYSAPKESDYASSGPSYSAPSSSYSAPSTSYPSSSTYSGSASYSPSVSSSSYPSSSSGSSTGTSSYASYKPVQSVKPASYPSRPLGIPIASFRVAASPSYGSSPQASRIRASAYPPPGSFSLGAFNSELASGVKYDEDY